MNIGMLWFDNDPKAALAAKVERAAAYYRSKYGKTPTVCFVHPSMLPAGEGESPAGNIIPEGDVIPKGSASLSSIPFSPAQQDAASMSEGVIPPSPGIFAAGVEVRSNSSVRPNHFWIGVNGVA